MIVSYHNLLWSCDVEGCINLFHLPKGFRHLYLICSYQHLLFGRFFYCFILRQTFKYPSMASVAERPSEFLILLYLPPHCYNYHTECGPCWEYNPELHVCWASTPPNSNILGLLVLTPLPFFLPPAERISVGTFLWVKYWEIPLK